MNVIFKFLCLRDKKPLSFLSSSIRRYPATQALWTASKANTEFFSSSTDGTVKWWDIRFIKRPTDTLVMDLDDPDRMDRFRAPGITAMHFESTNHHRFLAGLENGIVVNVNRRSDEPKEQLATRFECYNSSILTIDRNPIISRNFLTVAGHTAKVWSDETKEGFLLCTRYDFSKSKTFFSNRTKSKSLRVSIILNHRTISIIV